MTNPYRSLCAELATELEAWEKADDQFSESGTIRADANYGLAPHARAELAKPEPVAPTDEEMYDLWNSEGIEADFQDCRRFARAYAARWGTPTIEPVPQQEAV
jgi:hypothetical protein